MIIGSGMLARALAPVLGPRGDVLVFAAGVSNSACTDASEFAREAARLETARAAAADDVTMVYLGTCSARLPADRLTPYIRHKLAMEAIVQARPRHLVLRLPQVAGATPNPHTLLNWLHSRIARSERFVLWRDAMRNVIDATDFARVAPLLVAAPEFRNAVVDVASPVSHRMPEIVAAMERVVGKSAVFEAVDRGDAAAFDPAPVAPWWAAAGVAFDAGYLERVLVRYYGP
jgi:nucleoside-diphosphate-sugar epimerase